jgi:hypothetical protein
MLTIPGELFQLGELSDSGGERDHPAPSDGPGDLGSDPDAVHHRRGDAADHGVSRGRGGHLHAGHRSGCRFVKKNCTKIVNETGPVQC